MYSFGRQLASLVPVVIANKVSSRPRSQYELTSLPIQQKQALMTLTHPQIIATSFEQRVSTNKLPIFTKRDVQQCQENGRIICGLLYKGQKLVLDITEFSTYHPGGNLNFVNGYMVDIALLQKGLSFHNKSPLVAGYIEDCTIGTIGDGLDLPNLTEDHLKNLLPPEVLQFIKDKKVTVFSLFPFCIEYTVSGPDGRKKTKYIRENGAFFPWYGMYKSIYDTYCIQGQKSNSVDISLKSDDIFLSMDVIEMVRMAKQDPVFAAKLDDYFGVTIRNRQQEKKICFLDLQNLKGEYSQYPKACAGQFRGDVQHLNSNYSGWGLPWLQAIEFVSAKTTSMKPFLPPDPSEWYVKIKSIGEKGETIFVPGDIFVDARLIQNYEGKLHGIEGTRCLADLSGGLYLKRCNEIEVLYYKDSQSKSITVDYERLRNNYKDSQSKSLTVDYERLRNKL